jgi:hypothetical protein
MRPTPAAERLGVLRLGESAQDPWPAILSDPASGWSTFRYAQKIAPARVKPAVEILALAVPGSESSQEPAPSATPLVLTMRYGAGRSIYVATDETWRWRYGRGETLPERFWLPMIRMLARQGLAASNQAAVLEASPDRASVGQPVQVTVRLLDQSVLDARPKSIEARVSPKPRPGDSLAPGTSPVELRLVPAQADASDSRPPSVFSAIWIPTEPGNYSVAVTATLLAQTDLRVDVDVLFSDDELRDPRTDHALLAKLASETSGQVVPLTRLGELPGMLPNREIRLLGTPRTESLWDKPMVWMLLVTLLGLEWVIRRLIRLA